MTGLRFDTNAPPHPLRRKNPCSFFNIVFVSVGVLAALMLNTTTSWAQMPVPGCGVQDFTLSSLYVQPSGGQQTLILVETALTPEQQQCGMMFRTSVAPDQGMIFVFPEAKQASFWMRNTLIPLDIIFVRRNGRIANIIENAEPETLSSRPSKGRVIAVLELAGGQAAELGLKPGDMVRHHLLGNLADDHDN
ncbi:hypothetical protein BXY39_2485 [Eilatimonas milleporae]|uniref:DUF192 domain-containing protein n=2 Tax=Eilatimonas milleporae TaxID=911205 RepID=A0A3M0C516_9PROT|nr:hypothetical protein BXY39_2485 [Eilatimonas milleporae]